ncbi:MAG: hypothetical protein H8K07_22625 [Nitrospira sp.]|nr:hypothetical protein [Nitrospira sp.]
MAEARYLQITFEFEGPPKINELKPAFDEALDWARIDSNAWIVWTTSTPADWYSRIKPLIGANDRFYIFGIDNTVRHGWGHKWIWEWLDKKRP